MANDNGNPRARAPRTVKINRFQIALNVLVQVVVLFAILVMVNYLAFNHFKRWDKSRSHKYALSEKTIHVLATLKKPVKITVFFASGSDIYGDLTNLLKEYQYASNRKVEVETVDPYRNFSRARELQAKYKFGATENIVILDYDGRVKFVNANDMAEYDDSGAMYGQPQVLKAFKGEESVTGALREVTEDKQNKLYAVTGQSERDINSEDFKAIKTYIERENVKVESINLDNDSAVRQDAKILLILGPRYDFSEREIKLLSDFWEKKGRLFVLLDPDASTPHLDAFLSGLGVKPENDRILRTMNMMGATALVKDVVGKFASGSPITKRLAGVNGYFLGATQSLTLDQPRVQAAGIRLQPLSQSAEGYWGETDYNIHNGDEAPYFDSRKDFAPPLVIAASVEKGAVDDAHIQVDSSRMVVAGNADFISDTALSEANANLDFTISTLDWLLDREELIGIEPKVNQTFTLNLTEDQTGRIGLFVLVIIPGAVGIFGFGLWWKRRR